MEKIKISSTLDPDIDPELYNYFKDIPQRRRATFFRDLAVKGLRSNQSQETTEIKRNVEIKTEQNIPVSVKEEKAEQKQKNSLGSSILDID